MTSQFSSFSTTVCVAPLLGKVFLVADGCALVQASFVTEKKPSNPSTVVIESSGKYPRGEPDLLQEASLQITRYLEGRQRKFTIPIHPKGTNFERKIWDLLSEVPAGSWTTYREVARIVGRPEASRAVGSACRKNPIVIFIP